MLSLNEIMSDCEYSDIGKDDVEHAIVQAQEIVESFRGMYPHKDYSDQIILIAKMIMDREALYARDHQRRLEDIDE